jgi:hypothetical protein
MRLAPYGLGATRHGLGRTNPTGLRGVQRADRRLEVNQSALLSCPCPRVQSVTRATHARTLDRRSGSGNGQSSQGFGGPTTYEESSSDLHRGCLPRLCGVSRLSQPPDALFRRNPFRPCFVPVTSMGFRLQRFSPRGSRQASSAWPVLLAVSPTARKRKAAAPRM